MPHRLKEINLDELINGNNEIDTHKLVLLLSSIQNGVVALNDRVVEQIECDRAQLAELKELIEIMRGFKFVGKVIKVLAVGVTLLTPFALWIKDHFKWGM